MNKLIITSVSCVNNMASDIPETFTATLNEHQCQRIKELAQTLKAVKAHAIEEPDYSGTWSDAYINPHSIPANSPELIKTIEMLEADAAQVEIPMLRVTEDGFFFTATPKHCNDDMALSTNEIPLSALEDAEPFISLS